MNALAARERALERLAETDLRYAVRIASSGLVIASFIDLADARKYAKASFLEVYDIFRNAVVKEAIDTASVIG
jgi:hypothetical protein